MLCEACDIVEYCILPYDRNDHVSIVEYRTLHIYRHEVFEICTYVLITIVKQTKLNLKMMGAWFNNKFVQQFGRSL